MSKRLTLQKIKKLTSVIIDIEPGHFFQPQNCRNLFQVKKISKLNFIRQCFSFCNVISFCFSFLLGLALSVSPADGVFSVMSIRYQVSGIKTFLVMNLFLNTQYQIAGIRTFLVLKVIWQYIVSGIRTFFSDENTWYLLLAT